MRQKESDFAKKALKYLNKLPMCRAEKVHATAGMRGKADITGAIFGLRFEIELKMYDNKPTPLQRRYLTWWRENGCIAFAAWGMDDIVPVFEAIIEAHSRDRLKPVDIVIDVDKDFKPVFVATHANDRFLEFTSDKSLAA